MRTIWWGAARAAAPIGAAAAMACGGPKVPASPVGDGFGAPVVVSQATANGATPMFLVSPAGDRVLSWVSAPDGGEAGRLHVQVTPARGTAAAPVELVDPLGPIEPHGEAPPQLLADRQGHLYALYAVGKTIPGARFPVSALRLVRSEDGGRTWQPPVTVNEHGQHGDFGSHNFHALGLGNDGALWATWLENQRGRSSVVFTRSVDGGRTWAPTRALNTEEACPCCRTAIVAGTGNELFVAWRSVAAGDVRDIVVARSPDGGATWEAPVKPRDEGWVFPGCPHAGPSIKVDAEGRVHIAWWTGKPGEAGVWYGVSADRGRTWQAQAIATGATSQPAHVQLAIAPGGQVAVAWDDGLSASPRILLRRSRDGGIAFAATETVSGKGAAQYPVLATVGDSLLVAWRQLTLEAHRKELAARADMRDPRAVMGLPRVGQSEIWLRGGRL
ncbi:MAG: sialidase family protein [Gemmatimonadales bacterium]|nr:sialidase family protein [Gemmatimonadales bacterium]